VIASMTGTFNMTHPDAEHRRTGLQRLRVLAEVCPRIGTSFIHICTGTRDPNNMWRYHPDNGSPEAWRDMAACVREATDIVRQASIVLAFEPEVSNVVDSATKARRLLDEIGSRHLKVTMDPANLFHKGELPRVKEILDGAFSLLGRDDRYMSLLRKYEFKGPVLLHGLTREEVPGCLAFVRAKLASSFQRTA
jgi:sugar phosphate isomerase/epimerase